MNAVLERAKAHFSSLPRQEIDVPEWGEGDQPLKITWTALSIAERRKIYRPMEDGSNPLGGTVMVRALIDKACDQAGKRLFDGMAEHDLERNVAGEVVSRIGSRILFGDVAPSKGDDAVDTEKNG